MSMTEMPCVYSKGNDWLGFQYTTTPGHLIVTCDLEKAKMPFMYQLVTWDGQTLTEECGKMYSWEHNPYFKWRRVE